MKYLIRTFCIVSLAALTSCIATGPVYEPVEKIASDQAIIYIYRNPTLVAAGTLPPVVYVDEKEIGGIKAGGYQQVAVKPGDHNVTLKISKTRVNKGNPDTITVPIQAKAGKKYFVRYYLDLDVVLDPNPFFDRAYYDHQFVQVSEKIGESEIVDSRQLYP